VLDAELQGFPRSGAGSGVRNLVYVALPGGFLHDLEALRRVVPVHHLAILASGPLLDAIPALRGDGLDRARAAGVRISRIEIPAPASHSAIEDALERIPPDVDGAYLAPLRHLSGEQLERLIAGLMERRLPSFSILGESEVRRGILVGLTPEAFYQRLARRIALTVQRILLGEEPAEIPVTFPRRDKLVINMRTAREIGVSPRWEVLLEAELLHPLAEGLEAMDLGRAVEEAIETNLDLEARRRAVAAGAYEVDGARSILRPQLDVSALGVVIDDDRAAASLGARSERSATAGLAATQLLVSDAARANLEIQRHLQTAREAELDGLRLDIALDAAVAYLNVLRARTLVRVQRNNLDLTRRNLELARVRRDVGSGSPAEVYRWESELATDRKSLVEAHSARRQAEIALLRLLSRDQAQSLEYADVSPDDPELLTGSERFQALIDTPRRYAAFVELMVHDGLARAPELARFDAAIAARQRAVTAARRAFYTPTLSLSAQLDRILEQGGAGTDPDLDLFGDLPPPFELPRADDTSWSLALSARLPLFQGGARLAERLRAEEELQQLRFERRAVEERLTQRIRTALEAARGSYPGIELSRQAADAAARNLDFVTDAYARGAVSVLSVLDAQNAAFNADELAANAAHDFLVDLMRAERATSRFDFFLTAGERDAWYGRLEDWLRERGLSVEVPREGGS
jgi:outer membrane protein TolC